MTEKLHPIQTAMSERNIALSLMMGNRRETEDNLGALGLSTALIIAGVLMHKYGVGPEYCKAALLFFGSIGAGGLAIVEGFRQYISQEPHLSRKRFEDAKQRLTVECIKASMPVSYPDEFN